MNLSDISIEEIVFVIFGVGFLIQLWYYLAVFGHLAFYKKQVSASPNHPVSIIICARNEENNLKEFLPAVLTQDYPEFEVIVVNDCSSDDSMDVLDEFAKKFDRLKVIAIKEDKHYSHGKKVALMVGIKGAKYEYLLLTDADCKPQSKNWIKEMTSNFNEQTEIVLGYGAYEEDKGLLNKLIRFDTFYIGLQYLSHTLINKTYMGVGRNLAYKKSLFFNNKGFSSHYHIDSGDDDLFINEVAGKTKTRIETHPDSITISKAKKTFKEWIIQKRRHIQTSKYYTFSSKLNLGLINFSQYLFFASFITLLLFQYEVNIVLSIFFFRFFVQLFIFKKAMNTLGEKNLLVFSSLFEVFLLFFYPMVVVSNMFLKKNKWKR